MTDAPTTIAHVIAEMMERAGEPRPNGDILAAVLEQVLPAVRAPIPLADHEAAIAAAYERGREEALCLVGIVSLSAQNADRLDAMHEGRLMAVSEARAIIARAAEVEKEAGE